MLLPEGVRIGLRSGSQASRLERGSELRLEHVIGGRGLDWQLPGEGPVRVLRAGTDPKPFKARHALATLDLPLPLRVLGGNDGQMVFLYYVLPGDRPRLSGASTDWFPNNRILSIEADGPLERQQQGLVRMVPSAVAAGELAPIMISQPAGPPHRPFIARCRQRSTC